MDKACAKLAPLRLLSAGLLAGLSSATFASGFALIEQSASQMGNAFAGGAAFANDASTIYFNPAGMTRLPAQMIAGVHYVRTSAKFDGSATDIFGNPVSGGNGGDAGEGGLVPNFYVSLPLGDGLFAGLGINAPYGLATKYDSGWKGRYQAIESTLTTVNFNPSIAYKVNRQLSIGVGLNIQYIDAKLTQAVDQGSLCVPTQTQLQGLGVPGADPALCTGLTPQGNDALAEVKGDNWGGGFNLGVLYEPTDDTRLGISYRSQVKQELTGNARFRGTATPFSAFGLFVNTDVRADVNLPQSASFSVWHDFGSSWSAMADATWTGWNSFDELRISYDSFQPDTVVNESWTNAWRYSVGLNYRYNSRLTLRTGAAFDETPIPDAEHRTARIPANDRTWVSVGVGYKFSQAFGLDVAYSHLFIDNSKINETSTGGNLNGKYDGSVNIVSAQVVWNI